MRTEELDYQFSKELIATEPIEPRDEARLLVLDKKAEGLSHSNFKEIGKFFKKGDVLVFNKTKVFPARVFGKTEKGKDVEVVFLHEIRSGLWEVLIGGKIKEGEKITLSPTFIGSVRAKKRRL